MDQRPPSVSRPSTASSGTRIGTASMKRPKTAGRNSERPPSGQSQLAQAQFPQQRPVSRLGLVGTGVDGIRHSSVQSPSSGDSSFGISQMPSGRRPMTRGGNPVLQSPGSAMGMRVPSRKGMAFTSGASRMGTSTGARPGTAAINAADLAQRRQMIPPGTGSQRPRPITQQGLGGVRALQSRMGTAMGGRLVADKTYYMGLLNNQLNALEGEIDSLLAELEKAKKGQQNLLAYEQMAEGLANELKQLQGELTDYNLVKIIDRQNTNVNFGTLEEELMTERGSIQELTFTVEELFRERREKETHVHDLEVRIERIRVENAEQMNSMDREAREEYAVVVTEAEQLRAELDAKQTELEGLNRTKEELDMALANSPLKQQAMMLEEQIQELRSKRSAIHDELRSDETPEVQREHFVQRIQKNNEEIAHMQTQLQEMDERMVQAQEELKEFQNEFELLAGDKSDRFRELKARDAHMDAFLSSFEAQKAANEARIAEVSERIVALLSLIAVNCRHTDLAANISGLDESMFSMDGGGLGRGIGGGTANPGELQDLHVRLQEELISLTQNESLLRTELSAIHTQQEDIERNFSEVADLDAAKVRLRAKTTEANIRAQQLESELGRLGAENTELLRQIAASEQRLNSMPELAKLRDLKSRVDGLENERRVLQEKLQTQITNNDYGPLKQKVLELRAEYNVLLTTKVKH